MPELLFQHPARDDAREFLEIAHGLSISPQVTVFPLDHANEALQAARDESEQGSVVLVP